MNQSVHGSQGHRRIGEDPAPFTEGLVGGDEHRAVLVARADQLEQHAGLGLVLADIGNIVEDDQVVAIELGDR